MNSAPNPSTKSAATSLSRPSPVRSWGQNGVSSLLSQDVSSPLLLLPSPAQCVPIQFLKHVILCQNLDKLACVAVCNLDAYWWQVWSASTRACPHGTALGTTDTQSRRMKLHIRGVCVGGAHSLSCAHVPRSALSAQWMVPDAPLG